MHSSAGLAIVGRDAELATLRRLLEETRAGSSRVAVLEGEPGIGKTRLAQEITGYAAAADIAILSGVAEALQKDRPFGVIADALHIDDRPEDPARQRIAELLGAVPEPTVMGADHRYRIGEAMEDVVEREAIRRPVLFVVEDAHWADPSSILALHLISRRSDLPIFLLLTCRPVPRSEELRGLMDDIVESGGEHLRLQTLDESAVAGLARASIGAEPGPILRIQLARTAGNPLFVLELLDGLMEEHMIEIHDGTAETSTSVEPPPSLRSVIIRRLGFLSKATLELLRTASVLGESFSSTDLAALSGMSLPDVLAALRDPIGAGFISAAGDAFTFGHDVVREALYADLLPAVRTALHLHVGRTLAAAGAPAIRVAPHIALGAEAGDRQAVEWLREAARDIRSRAPAIAADLMERAADLLPPGDPERTALLTQKAFMDGVSGRMRQADEQLEQLRLLSAGTPGEVRLDYVRLMLLMIQFRVVEADEVADRLLSSSALRDPLRGDVLGMSGVARAVLGNVRGALARVEEARSFVDANPISLGAASCLRVEGALCWGQGRFTKAVGFLARGVPAAESSGGTGISLGYLGAAQVLADRFDAARETLESAREVLQRTGRMPFITEYHWFLANLHFARGHWDDALAEIEASRQATRETGASGVRSVLTDPTPLVHLFRGDTARAREGFSMIEADPSAGVSPMVAHWMEPIRAVLQGAAGDLDAAVATVGSWHAALSAATFIPDFRSVGRALVTLCRAAGDEALVQQLRADAETAYGRADGVKSVEGAALLVQGAIADDIEVLMAAVEASRAGARPFDTAEACAEAGVNLLRRGSPDAGRPLVMDAFEIYERLDARQQEAALAKDVRAFGIRRGSRRPRRGASHGWDSLTDSEGRVIALVAEGLTNGEIGQRLFISRGTVATHLRSVFRKLGVSSRSELAAEAARRPD